MPRLNPATRNIVIGRLQARQSQNEVARNLNVNQSTISRLWNRFQQTGSSNDCPRSERPRIATPGQDLYTRVFHLRNRTVSASTTAVGIPGLRRSSSQRVRNRLRQHGIHIQLLRSSRDFHDTLFTNIILYVFIFPICLCQRSRSI